MREVRRERAAAVMWTRSCSERGDGPGMGGSGREGGREGGGFEGVGTFWGIKVGGAGNSLRRTGTGGLRLCFTEDRVMVRGQGQGSRCECMRVVSTSTSKEPQGCCWSTSKSSHKSKREAIR